MWVQNAWGWFWAVEAFERQVMRWCSTIETRELMGLVNFPTDWELTNLEIRVLITKFDLGQNKARKCANKNNPLSKIRLSQDYLHVPKSMDQFRCIICLAIQKDKVRKTRKGCLTCNVNLCTNHDNIFHSKKLYNEMGGAESDLVKY